MFKKGFDYYFDIAYILLLFLCFLFFMPYLVLALLIHLKIDNFISLQCRPRMTLLFFRDWIQRSEIT